MHCHNLCLHQILGQPNQEAWGSGDNVGCRGDLRNPCKIVFKKSEWKIPVGDVSLDGRKTTMSKE
jgi:hypothetical protein